MRLLVVDDEPQVGKTIRRLVRDAGWSVDVAYSGEEALRKLAAARPDVVLTDFRMPGMDGLQLLAEVRRADPTVRRLLMSGQADFDHVAAGAAEAEVEAFVAKPWNGDELLRILDGGRRS